MYAVFGGLHTGDQCCFDFGNAEIAGTNNGNATMNALYFGRLCWDGCGPDGGPWIQADLENGVYMSSTPTATAESFFAYAGGPYMAGQGFCCAASPETRAWKIPFVTAILENPGAESFALRGADATSGALSTLYDGPVPSGGYSPMKQEGAIILGSGGDQGTASGEFFEGAITFGVPSLAAQQAVQANIASVGYRMRGGS